MPDDVLPVEDIAIANLIGAEDGLWDAASQPYWRLTWTEKAAVPLVMGVAECCADIAVPWDEL